MPRSLPAGATIFRDRAVLEAARSRCARPAVPTSTAISHDGLNVEPPASELDRIREDHEKVGRVWSSGDAERRWTGPFHLPVDAPPRDNFGSRRVLSASRHHLLMLLPIAARYRHLRRPIRDSPRAEAPPPPPAAAQ